MSIHQDKFSNEISNQEVLPFSSFLQWYVLTEDQKKKYNLPLTIAEYCEKSNIKPETVIAYRSHPQWSKEYKKALNAWSAERTMDHLHALNKKIEKDNSTKDILAFSQISSELTKSSKSDDIPGFNLTVNLSQNNYEAIVKREAGALRGTVEVIKPQNVETSGD